MVSQSLFVKPVWARYFFEGIQAAIHAFKETGVPLKKVADGRIVEQPFNVNIDRIDNERPDQNGRNQNAFEFGPDEFRSRRPPGESAALR